MATSAVVIQHPNRDKGESKATKAGVVLLLIVSAALITIMIAGGWEKLQGAQGIAIAYVVIYLVMAFFVLRWSRGVLPLAAGLAVIFAVFSAIAAPAWFARDKDGFDNPALPPGLLGLLALVVIGVQFLLILFAVRGFTQAWNVEVEVPRDEHERGVRYDVEGDTIDGTDSHADTQPGYDDTSPGVLTDPHEDRGPQTGHQTAGGADPTRQ